MSRYSSIDSSSSRSVTKCWWLRSSRRSSPDSLMISMRAVSGCDRISDEIDASVLKRKCGLIWLLSASIFAASSSFSCSCRRCSMRALFQILMGVATASTVASTTSAVIQCDVDPEVEQPILAEPQAERLAQQLERDRREQQHELPVRFELPHHVPEVLPQVHEDERRELPDRFLRDTLRAGRPRRSRSRWQTGTAMSSPASERREGDERADERPRVQVRQSARRGTRPRASGRRRCS